MTFKTLIDGILAVLAVYIMPLLLTLAVLAFVWRAAYYFILHGSDDGAREKGRQTVVWGLFGIVALVALWGIINIVLSTVQITPGR